ncbi:MAG: TetR/AcrR family transcriptional regulator C-terminal domain-containing protein [Butyrivibrio sp.]|nr:TetR/AcrR family transcriptional regulator C-terminal domain-containing protein [Butyrivibrio sp.]
MEQIKELTKRLIANSFKELLQQVPFEKITIKMITDHANVIRPTFYNHFHDKYELVEWIVREEILDGAAVKLHDGDGSGAIRMIITGFYEEREYYRRAFDIIGQNGFAETLSGQLKEMFEKAYSNDKRLEALPVETGLAARYYANGIITVIRYALFEAGDSTLEEIIDMYIYLMKHTIFELLD